MGWMLETFLKTISRTTLSTFAAKRPTPSSTAPGTHRSPSASTTTPGTHTSALPSMGSTDTSAVITPQKAALGSPTAQKPMPTMKPWMVAVSAVPTSVASVTRWKRSRSPSAVRSEKGRKPRTLRQTVPG